MQATRKSLDLGIPAPNELGSIHDRRLSRDTIAQNQISQRINLTMVKMRDASSGAQPRVRAGRVP
jgi:hypothetical protein